MATDITTEAVRLALGISQMRAEYASQNIARAGTPGAQAVRLDFGASQGLLAQAVTADAGDDMLLDALTQAASQPAPSRVDAGSVQLDEEVADMSAANLTFQSLSESLSRHFGLMRLAITGRN